MTNKLKAFTLRDLGLGNRPAPSSPEAPAAREDSRDRRPRRPEPTQHAARADKPAAPMPAPAVARPVPPATSAAAPVVPAPESTVSVRGQRTSDGMAKILLDLGVRPGHVQVALRRAAQTGESLAQIMRDFGFLSGEGVAQAVSRQSGLEYFSSEALDQLDKRQLERIEFSEYKKFAPVGFDPDGTLRIAVPDVNVVNEARNYFHHHKSRAVVASEHTIQSVYRRFFAKTEEAFDAAVAAFMQTLSGGRRQDADDRAIGLMREVYFLMLRHACYTGASDLYLYRSDFVGIVRLKVNGVGQIFRTIDLALYDRILNKLVQDNVKADELRAKPRESIVEFSDEDRAAYPDLAERFNFRLELTESRGVRSGVIRILDRNSAATDLNKLGFDDETYKAIVRISQTSTGFFLVTGPTGSGKTTSLYAILKSIDAVERSVQSIENPIEYEHGLWLQFEPRRDSTDEGESFNEWLKALLRNAPDVILVGEVRDSSVANICLSAANTGHLVFATLHTNDAVMAVARLKSLQIDLDVLGSVLLGVLAQRLLRLLCKDCKVPDQSEDTAELFDDTYLGTALRTPTAFKAGAGCPNCDYTGYRGRRMIYELLQMNSGVRQALEKGEAPSVIAQHGMPLQKTMWATGLRLVMQGHTSADELRRVATRHI